MLDAINKPLNNSDVSMTSTRAAATPTQIIHLSILKFRYEDIKCLGVKLTKILDDLKEKIEI